MNFLRDFSDIYVTDDIKGTSAFVFGARDAGLLTALPSKRVVLFHCPSVLCRVVVVLRRSQVRGSITASTFFPACCGCLPALGIIVGIGGGLLNPVCAKNSQPKQLEEQ